MLPAHTTSLSRIVVPVCTTCSMKLLKEIIFPFISVKVGQEIPVVKIFLKNHKGEILDILLYLTSIKLTVVLFGRCGPLRR
jgi:hypothetical protein